MKKVIFISALAIAAAASCTKSDIVDTKFNEAIGFEAYVGRDAQTKASVVDASNIGTAGLYGFYTGGAGWTDQSTANLWANEALNCTDGTVTNKKYWTNAEDKYTFMAFAPQTNTNLSAIPTGNEVKNPTVTYTVPTALATQIDLTYANAFDVTKTKVDASSSKKVDMAFKHALARLTVKAKDGSDVFDFDVKEISIKGNFNTAGTLTLADGSWSGLTNKEETYVFHTTEAAYSTETALTSEFKDYAGSNNYLMMIPVNFGAEDATAATVTVKYTTYYQNQESTVNTATFSVNTNFVQGKAYAINLTFTKETQEIVFNVTVDNWDEGTVVDGKNPQHKDEEIKA